MGPDLPQASTVIQREILVPDRRVALGDLAGQRDQRSPAAAELCQRLADTFGLDAQDCRSRPS